MDIDNLIGGEATLQLLMILLGWGARDLHLWDGSLLESNEIVRILRHDLLPESEKNVNISCVLDSIISFYFKKK